MRHAPHASPRCYIIGAVDLGAGLGAAWVLPAAAGSLGLDRRSVPRLPTRKHAAITHMTATTAAVAVAAAMLRRAHRSADLVRVTAHLPLVLRLVNVFGRLRVEFAQRLVRHGGRGAHIRFIVSAKLRERLQQHARASYTLLANYEYSGDSRSEWRKPARLG